MKWFLILALFGCKIDIADEGFVRGFKGMETTWAKRQIGIEMDLTPVYKTACQNAIIYYNYIIGRDFIINGTDIFVQNDAGAEPGHGFTDISYRAWNIVHAEITLPLSSQDVAWQVCAHEIGHALGLEHDRNPWSIMYPRVRNGSLTQHDKILLKNQYGW